MQENLPTKSLGRETPSLRINPGYGPETDSWNQQGDIQLKQYWRTVLKYRKLIASTVGFFFLVALIYVFTTAPRYTATAKLRISPYQAALAATKIEDMLEQSSRESNYFDTQVQEISSFSLADLVLQDERIKDFIKDKSQGGGFFSRIFGSGKSSEEEKKTTQGASTYTATIQEVEAYLNYINVSPVRRTTLVNVSATLGDPELAAHIANKHASSYIDWVRFKRIEQQSRGLAFLQTQAAELREKVSGIERELADYAEANSIVAVNKDENITVQKMAQLNQLLTSAMAKSIEAENAYKEAESAAKNESAGMDDPSVQTMRAELGKLEAERELLATKFTASYPRMKQIISQIERLKTSITGQRGQILTGLKARAAAAKAEETRLKEELERQKSHTFELTKSQVQYNVLNRELTASRELLQNILSQIKETSVAVENNSSNVAIVDQAAVPVRPSYPKKRLMLFLSLLLGLGAGLGLAFLLAYLDDTVRTPEDMTERIRVANLGVVPSFGIALKALPGIYGSRYQRNGDDTPKLPPPDPEAKPPTDEELPATLPTFIRHPQSLASEAYRTIRTGLLLSQAGEPPRTLLVTSAKSSEGKTTSAVNLAASFGGSGGRVLLIDADLRRPSMHRHFNLDYTQSGLVEVLTGQATLDECTLENIIPNVSVVTSGKIPPNPAELLGSQVMSRLIEEASSKYDYVIIDSPPVLPVTDSVILSRYVDGVVLIVKSGETPRRVVVDAFDRLKAVGARVLGAVLNDVDISKGEYYYYNRYYHSYYAEEHNSGPRQAASG